MTDRSPPGRLLLERELDPIRAFALYHFLDAHGIPVTLAEPAMRGAMGEIPFQEMPAEIYLEDASRLVEAQALIKKYRQGPTVRGAVWHCGACGEQHEPEYYSCWNCGEPRPQ